MEEEEEDEAFDERAPADVYTCLSPPAAPAELSSWALWGRSTWEKGCAGFGGLVPPTCGGSSEEKHASSGGTEEEAPDATDPPPDAPCCWDGLLLLPSPPPPPPPLEGTEEAEAVLEPSRQSWGSGGSSSGSGSQAQDAPPSRSTCRQISSVICIWWICRCCSTCSSSRITAMLRWARGGCPPPEAAAGTAPGTGSGVTGLGGPPSGTGLGLLVGGWWGGGHSGAAEEAVGEDVVVVADTPSFGDAMRTRARQGWCGGWCECVGWVRAW